MKVRLSLAVFVVLSICGIRLEGANTATPRRVVVTAKQFAFSPAEITLTKGEPVVLVVKSVDVAHGLSFRELGLELKVPKEEALSYALRRIKTVILSDIAQFSAEQAMAE